MGFGSSALHVQLRLGSGRFLPPEVRHPTSEQVPSAAFLQVARLNAWSRAGAHKPSPEQRRQLHPPRSRAERGLDYVFLIWPYHCPAYDSVWTDLVKQQSWGLSARIQVKGLGFGCHICVQPGRRTRPASHNFQRGMLPSR